MKNIFTTLFIIGFSLMGYSQVIIGDETGTAADKTSVLLEFANTGNKGLILPYVTALPGAPTPGTIALDASVPTSARVKYYNGSWIDLSGQDADVSSAMASQPNTTELATAKAIIGSPTSTADGVLVLESPNKALVLPIVDDVNNIPSPSPGMMVYINKVGAKRLAVFNGANWSFWKQ